MNLHLLIQLTPRSNVLLQDMREAPHLLHSSTLIYFGEWSDSGYEFIATKHMTDTNGDSTALSFKNIPAIIKTMTDMYHDTVKASQLYFQETDHYVYMSP